MVKRKGVVAAIGNFDGVHRGHRRLIAKAVSFAQALGGEAGAVVFDPHPRRYFRPADPPFLLTSPARRDALLEDAGARRVHSVPFNAELAALTPEQFVKDVLKDRLNLMGVVTGTEFRFGRDRAGDAATLRSLCEKSGIAALLVEPKAERAEGQKIGSSEIRQAIADGDVKEAALMLGRRWSVDGVVLEGQKLGRTLGFPTANISLGELIEPKRGVYAMEAFVDAARFEAVAYFGRRPTIAEAAPLLEVHLFDFEGDLYGRMIEAAFVDFIRDDRKFESLDALKKQIDADARTARRMMELNR